MAGAETRPLLEPTRHSWNHRSVTRLPASSGGGTSSDLQENNRDPLSERAQCPESPIRHPWQVRSALTLILLAVVLERLSFYGLVGNLVLFLNERPYDWESYNAINASFLFFGISYIMSLIGGWISDSLLGHFKTIIMAYGIYLCGYLILPFLTQVQTSNHTSNMSLPGICHSSENSSSTILLSDNYTLKNAFEEACSWLIFITLIVIAAGSGILKANICPFGADQLVHVSQQTQLSFFNLFYWSINLGSFLGLGAIAYVEQQESFQTGFIVCAVTLGCSIFAFIAGRCFYISRSPDGSVLTNIFKILRGAWQNRRQRRLLLCNPTTTTPEGSGTKGDETLHVKRTISFLDYAKHCYGGSFHDSLVDDVKKLGTILSVFAVLIPYWLVYFQMQTTFLIQGLHMKLDLSKIPLIKEFVIGSNESVSEIDVYDPKKFKVAVAWFSLCDAVVVIILLPLFDRVIYPRMARAGYPFTFSKRIILGMLFAMAAVVAAGIVEHYRLQAYWPNPHIWCESNSILQIIGGTTYFAADMSVFWQIPQYTLIGISEVFASVASLQFAVMFAPKSMKAVITGLFYFISGIASFLGIAFVAILASTKTWFQSYDFGDINCRANCKDINNIPKGSCHLDYYFYSLAVCEAVGLILFLIVSRVFNLNSDDYVNHVRKEETTPKRNVQ